jgi:hypothetical protein
MANIAPAERSSAPLAGKYTRHGGKLTGTTTLLLVHRSTPTPAKAPTYVLLVDEHGKRHYVSSLWDGPTPGTYALEYRGVRYTVTMTDTTALVFPQGGTGYSSVPPVAKTATIEDISPTPLDTVL